MTLSHRGLIRATLSLALMTGIAACSQDASTPIGPPESGRLGLSSAESAEATLVNILESSNAALAAEGLPYRVGMIEAISGDPDEAGITVLWKDVGNKRLSHDFVPNDPRRAAATGGWSADPNQITWAIDPVDGATFNGVDAATTSAEIRDAMGTWAGLSCSGAGLAEVASPVDLGIIAFLNGLGGSPFVVADIHHAGWLEVEFGGGTIAATFTFVWIDGAGNPTDIDGDGRDDTAFREIYYDAVCQACTPVNFWNWEIDDGLDEPGFEIDIESIVLHESGHGLSMGHFGKGFVTMSNNILHQTSNSVMAAAYAGPRTDLQGSDKAGHCNDWGSWPNN